jgi:hypothetical protein
MTQMSPASASHCGVLANPTSSPGVVGRRTVAVRDLAGIITRLHYVAEAELPRTVPADRAYVAAEAEMKAFRKRHANRRSSLAYNCLQTEE